MTEENSNYIIDKKQNQEQNKLENELKIEYYDKRRTRTMDGYESMVSEPDIGVINISRTHGGNTHLVGCTTPHDTQIRLTIKQGERLDDVYGEFPKFYGRNKLIEIMLSPIQFAELITSVNVGDGIPCTINQINNDLIPRTTQGVNITEICDRNIDRQVDDYKKGCRELLELTEELLSSNKSTITKAKKQELYRKAQFVNSRLESNIDFSVKQAKRNIAKTEIEVKRSIEASIQDLINKTGFESSKLLMSYINKFGMTEEAKQLLGDVPEQEQLVENVDSE